MNNKTYTTEEEKSTSSQTLLSVAEALAGFSVDDNQLSLMERFTAEFRQWNARMNLVSRKDIDQFERHHLWHSVALSQVFRFPDGARVLDVGTGGGLPGMPLAVLFPRVQFFLLDSVAKKAAAVESMRAALGLTNVTVVRKRAEELESKWDYILGRAVAALPTFLGWIAKNLRPGGLQEAPHGVLYWKGTLYREELSELSLEPQQVWPLERLTSDPYYADKYIIHLEGRAVQRAAPKPDAQAAKGRPSPSRRRSPRPQA